MTNSAYKKPHEYQRRILLAASGLSPAILTETVYALAHQTPPFIPTEIHLLTTATGREQAENLFIKSSESVLQNLVDDYQLGEITFDKSQIHTISDANGNPVSDISDPLANEHAADFITKKVSELTQDDNTAIHASLAGGRKTLGFYLGYAMSIYGREQDRLSHVLVDPQYERCGDFFYPTPKSEIGRYFDGKNVLRIDFAEAKVYLVDIPFVRMHTRLPKNDALLTGSISFSKSVELAQAANRDTSIKVDLESGDIELNGYHFNWSDENAQHMAMLAWLLLHFKKHGAIKYPNQNSEANKEYGQELLELLELTGNGCVSNKQIRALKAGMDSQHYSTKKSRMKQALECELGVDLAQKLATANHKKDNIDTFAIDPDRIEIIGYEL